MKFALNDFWMLRLIGKNHSLKERIRGYFLPGSTVMDPRTLGDVQGMSVAPRWDGSGTTAIKWFLDFRAWERDWMYGLTDAMRRAVLLSLIPASRSNPLKEMVNRYQFRYQELLREVTEEVFTECNGIATGSARADIREMKMADQRRAHSAFKVLLLRKHFLDVMLPCCPCRYNKLIK